MVFEHDMKSLKTDKGETVSASALTFLLLALADHANNEGMSIYPGVRRLVAKTKLTQKTVCKGLAALQKHGYLGYTGYSRLGTKEYFINLSNLESKEPLFTKDYNSKSESKATYILENEDNESKATLLTDTEKVKPLHFQSKATLPDTSLNHHLNNNHQLLTDSFKSMHKALFKNTFNNTYWDIMESSEMKLEGDILKIFVNNQSMVDDVNNKARSSQWSIGLSGWPFKGFELVLNSDKHQVEIHKNIESYLINEKKLIKTKDKKSHTNWTDGIADILNLTDFDEKKTKELIDQSIKELDKIPDFIIYSPKVLVKSIGAIVGKEARGKSKKSYGKEFNPADIGIGV